MTGSAYSVLSATILGLAVYASPAVADVRENPISSPAPESRIAAAPSGSNSSAKPAVASKADSLKTDSTAASAVKPADTAQAQAADTTAPEKRLYEFISYPILQLVTLPIEWVLVPTVKGLIYPTKEPLKYFLNENVIDRTIQLISYGSKNQVMLYPTMNLAPGTGSYTGLTLRYQSLFGRPTENMVARGNIYVNGDWRFRSYFNALHLLGTDFDGKASIGLVRVKNTSVTQPGTNATWFYADTSNTYTISLAHRVVEKISLKGTFLYRTNHYGAAPHEEQPLQSEFFRGPDGQFSETLRGLNQDWNDRNYALGISRDTRNNENITLAGSKFDAIYHYHNTTQGHDYMGWEIEAAKFFKLGKEKYEISRDEERKAGEVNLKKMLEEMEYEKLRHEIFNRKVVVIHFYGSRTYELPGNHMPVYGLQSLGNDTPLRGYGGSRFRDYAVAAISSEYRFPVMRLVDGVIFDEYGVYGPAYDKFDFTDNLKNSWGFGIRVRRPDIYLFRCQLGFHGEQGIQLNLSVDEPY